MLQFIFGLPKTGKTFTMHGKIKECAENKIPVAVIVPEQFSFESERFILDNLGTNATNVKVLSFSRLCDEVGRISGGIAGAVLSDSDKIIIMKNAIRCVKDDFELLGGNNSWGRYVGSDNFAAAMLNTIDEFKLNAVTPFDIRDAALKINSSLKTKLNNTALIFDKYNELLGERFIDPSDKLTKLYLSLKTTEYFKDKAVFFDGFTGFTGQQYKIIDRIFSQTENVTFSFTNDTESALEFDVFSNIRSAVEKIKNIADKHGVETDKPIVLRDCLYSHDSLKDLERLLAGKTVNSEIDDGAVSICEAMTSVDEANFTAREIHKLVREKGYRFSDFTVVARDTKTYEEAFISACRENNISLFADSKVGLSSFPLSVAVNCALKLVKKFNSGDILRFNKTGLGNLTYDEVSILENYVLLWGIEGKAWLDNWDMDVRGMSTDPQTEETKAKLKTINELREKAISPILHFKNDVKGNATDIAKAIVNLTKNTNMQDSLTKMCDRFEQNGDTYSADILRQSYATFMAIVDSTVRCLGEDNEDFEDFVSSFATAVSLTTVGTTPQTLDEVTFCGADHIAQNRPKVVFVLGANLGVFPKAVSSTGILTPFERSCLIDTGIDISDNSIKSTVEENFLVYTNLLSASDKVYISYSKQSLQGASLETSAFVSDILENIKVKKYYSPTSDLEQNYPETAASAYTYICENLNDEKQNTATIIKALNNNGILVKTEDFVPSERNKISKETALKLYKENIYMSASKVDTFQKCPFSYFCRYGLNATKLEPVVFDVLQRGTIVHFVLEKVVKNNGNELPTLTKTEIKLLVDKYFDEYLSGVSGFNNTKNAYIEFLISKMQIMVCDVVVRMAKEFAQSKFVPTGCEVKIGHDGEIPPLKFQLEKGKLVITGSIDRVDEYNGYVRVIDYKTGNRKFRLSDVLYGLNLQMLIYLYAATVGNGKSEKDAAGILYMQAKRDYDESLVMNGLLLKDIEVVKAMEAENKGEFVPELKLNNNGEYRQNQSSFVDSEELKEIFDYIEKTLVNCGNRIQNGDISVSPVDGGDLDACKYCDYKAICMIGNAEHKKAPKISNKAFFETIKGGEADGN